MFTACDCEPSTPVRYACIVAAETATSWPWPLTCASTQTTASAAMAASTAGRSRFATASFTRLAGACAKTNRLCVVPTSCGRGCTWALTLAVVVFTLPVTVIGNTGGGATFAAKVPCSARGVPFWCVAETFSVPDVPFQVPVNGHVTPGPGVYVHVPSAFTVWIRRLGMTSVPVRPPGWDTSRP